MTGNSDYLPSPDPPVLNAQIISGAVFDDPKLIKDTRKENEVQESIISGLRMYGYIVEQTTVRYKLQTCKRCGNRFRPEGGYGSSRGISDLIVRHPKWGESYGFDCFWTQLEVKGPKTKLSPEQVVLRDGKHIIIVRSFTEAFQFLQRVEAELLRLFSLGVRMNIL